ncbi:MAG: diacylglycerol/lipid kinase family protein [Armatimonadota bacterium]
MSTENMLTAGGAVVFNPAAGRGKGVERLEAAKRALGPEYEWVPTQRPGHAVELGRELATRCPVVVAFGGDGTVGDVVRGIHGTGAILGIIPAGTGNDVARNLGIPFDPTEAARVIHEGSALSVDIGLINGVPFINNAGTGFDSRVMQTMNTGIRFARGRIAFNLAILKTIFQFPPFRLTLGIDDETDQVIPDAMLVSVLNGRVYGAGMPAAPEARMDDGRLDVLVIRNLPKLQRLPLLVRLQNAQHIGHPAVSLVRASSLRIAATPPQPMNVDGEIRGSTPVEITVESRALKVLVR